MVGQRPSTLTLNVYLKKKGGKGEKCEHFQENNASLKTMMKIRKFYGQISPEKYFLLSAIFKSH